MWGHYILSIYISREMTPTSIGGEEQACISGGVNPPADIASGRIAEAYNTKSSDAGTMSHIHPFVSIPSYLRSIDPETQRV